MSEAMKVVGAVCVLLLLGAACGESQKVGSEKLLEFEEQENAQRLGERTPEPTPEGTPRSLGVGEEERAAPTPTPEPTATPEPEYFDIALVPNSPYYEPGNSITIPAGTTIRVTNRDDTAERSDGRSFTAKNGAFHSGLLKPGESWTQLFSNPSTYEIIDEGLRFATGTLRVVP